MAAESEHAADESAGGEIVYSSDGLAPLPLTGPEGSGKGDGVSKTGAGGVGSSGSSPSGTAVGDMILDSAHLEASQAFEIFAGKIYPNKSGASAGTGTIVKKENETALERLARLQQEVMELEDDLKATQPQEDGTGTSQPLVDVIQDLKKRLEESNSQMRPSQEELTRLVHDQLQNFQSKPKDAAAATSDASSGVIYELYGTKMAEPDSTGTTQRLLQLEKILGTDTAAAPGTSTPLTTSTTASTTTTTNTSTKSSSSGSNNKSILQRLEEMESTLDNLDETALEQAAAKAKVIRADLEAASKARNKLLLVSNSTVGTGTAASSDKTSASPSQTSTSNSMMNNDSKTIAALYDQLQQLEGLSGHLPALVNRLQQLATLHSQSATYSSRLVLSEKEIQQLNKTFTQLEQTFNQLESSTVKNLSTMEENIKQLDERLKNIS